MHKKDLENMQDHSERIIKNYETEIKNVRDKLCKFRQVTSFICFSSKDKNRARQIQWRT